MLLFFISLYSPGTLPYAQNSPQKCKYDLYAEQVSGLVLYMMASHDLIAELDDGDVVRSSASGE